MAINKQHYAMSLEQVGKELGISRSRVQQIEQQALEKVRKALDEKGLTATALDSDPPGYCHLLDLDEVTFP